MLFRSVVGKLWITIIILVSSIFLFLSIFLIEYFDHYYYVEQSKNLSKYGEQISGIINDYDNKNRALETVKEVTRTLDVDILIVHFDNEGNIIAPTPVFTKEELKEIYSNKYNVVRLNDQTYKDFISFNSSNDQLAMAIPLYENDKVNSAIILYQSLGVLYQTTNDIKKIVLLFAAIGIILATIFTFFLSTRITAPLRQMQKAAVQIAKGDFQNKVNIKSNDEIGGLALSFNKMASQLDDTVKALSSEKEKLANVLESMADAVITVNKSGEVMMSNPPADILLRSWDNPKILPKSLMEMLKREIDEKINLEKDIHISGRTFSVKMAPLYSNKNISGAVTVLRDVTYERKLNKLRRDFLANVSHELRTPISMLQGYSEAIIDDIAESPEEKKELAQIIYDESLRMGRLVNELLDLAKMESGNFQLLYCKVDIHNLINKMIRKFSSLANEHDVKIQSEIDPKLSEAYFDIDRMEQVITNLLDNALRHTPRGGTIVIRARSKGIQQMLIEIEDSGIGIPEEDLPYVFERFYKADKARTRGQSGTGLGLSIVKNIVTAHGGDINVTSKKNQGTTFSITLPTNILSIE